MQAKKKILIADDHTLFRDGLRMLLSRNEELEVVGEASDGMDAVQMARDLEPDLVIMDITMPRLSGIEATREIIAVLPSTRVIILSVHSRRAFIMEALEAGARGYVLKDSARMKLLFAVEAVLMGESYLDSPAASHIVNEFVNKGVGNLKAAERKTLTAREQQVLHLIVDGHSNREIAEKLFISHKTVDTHRMNLMNKLGVHDVVGMIKYAIASGLVDPDVWSRKSASPDLAAQ